MNENELNKAKQMKDQLNAVGPGFCLAKWDQVTMHLHTGMTHSCHHPAPHKVNLEDLKRNPTAIHNSTQKLQERTAMLCGDRPSPCNYCWKMEDANPDAISDRYLKSANLFSNNFDLIASSGTGASYIPSYVEVSFSNACNLKCTYCGPTFSSKWQQEQEQNENIALYDLNSKERSWNYHNLDYLKSIDELPYKNSEHNPYVDAFWKWWPELRKNIKHLRITGGEPLMAKDTFRLLDELQKNPIPDLEFSLNTNLNAPEKNWQQLLDFIKRNEDEQLVKKITLYTSLDGWGKQAEYIRSGLDFNLLWERLLYLIEEHPSVDNSIMTTYSLLSVPNYKTLLENVLEVKQKYNRYNGILERRQEQYKDWFESVGQGSFFERNEIRCCAVHLDISTLSFPHFLSVAVLDREYSMPKLWKQYEFMAKHLTLGKDDQNFYDFETEKLGRVCDIAFYTAENEQDYNENLNYHRANFYMFINEMDKRRGTDFVKTFPELEDFYYSCKKSVDKLK